ncbi:MAG: alkaline phosphatase family protein [Flavobacteriaceae bacterium]|nr:alkaline phosphatase family protein [Flavobacteriaceae bacterium]
MKKLFFLSVILLLSTSCKAQEITQTSENKIIKNSKPKLVIGIVVDQMRYDYLIRFYNKYSKGGLKRLMNNGYNLKNTHLNYSSTKTAVGHTSIYTGTTPNNHGILANDWYDKPSKKWINCVGDERYNTIGSPSINGKKSPHRNQVTTIGDQLHIAQNMQGKVIGISLKDRGSILPAGHSANAAYWYDGDDIGNWISSSYYMKELPKWVQNFNEAKKVDEYLSKTWSTYYDISTYTESAPDLNNYEQKLKGKSTATFPYDLPKLRALNGNYNLIRETPFGNSLTVDFAIEAIKNENLGKSEFTDLLAVSFSSTDYMGHGFGVSSKEIEDAYIRLDKDLERLLLFLDTQVGKNNYTLFLTADHGATEVPKYLADRSIPARYIDKQKLRNDIKQIAKEYFGTDNLIEHISNNTIYLNKEEIKNLKLNLTSVQEIIANELINHKYIYKVVTAKTLQTTNFTTGFMNLVQNSYNQKLSGDIVFVYKPLSITNYYENQGGTTHGTGYNYNTHVPLLFYGNGITKGETFQYYPIIDIAPTISALLNIEFPNGNTGKVIEEVLE